MPRKPAFPNANAQMMRSASVPAASSNGSGQVTSAELEAKPQARGGAVLLPKAEDKPLLVPPPRARKIIGVGNTKFWGLVKDGTIPTVMVGGRRMVPYASLEALAKPSAQNIP